MGNKFEILENNAEYLWEHGETRRQHTTRSWKGETESDKKQRMDACRKRAVDTFYQLGSFSREEVRRPDVWRNIFSFLMATLQGIKPDDYYGDEFSKRAEALQKQVDDVYFIRTWKDRLILLVIVLIFGGLGAVVFLSDREPIAGVFRNIMILVCLIMIFVGFSIGRIIGAIVGFFLTAIILWLTVTFPAARIVLAVICALLALCLVPDIFLIPEDHNGGR